MRLSIIDFGPPGVSLVTAPVADQLGYTRYWLGEHHAPHHCASPLLLTGVVAGLTEQIRVGPAGVCLPFYSPFKVAEDARLLEELYPGRLDLGVVRGLIVASKVILDDLLDGRSPETTRTFEQKMEELFAVLRGETGYSPLCAEPFGVSSACPSLWVMGTSRKSAEHAVALRANFCFSEHHNQRRVGGASPASARDVVGWFRDHSPMDVAVVVSGLCASTETFVQDCIAAVGAGFDPSLHTFLGTPEQCACAMATFGERVRTPELVLLNQVPFNLGFDRIAEERHHALKGLAKAFHIQP